MNEGADLPGLPVTRSREERLAALEELLNFCLPDLTVEEMDEIINEQIEAGLSDLIHVDPRPAAD